MVTVRELKAESREGGGFWGYQVRWSAIAGGRPEYVYPYPLEQSPRYAIGRGIDPSGDRWHWYVGQRAEDGESGWND